MKDLILDENGDFKVENGDLTIDDGEYQQIEALLMTHKGEIKLNPYCGTGISKYLRSSGKEKQMKRVVTLELKKDIFKNAEVAIGQDGKILIET